MFKIFADSGGDGVHLYVSQQLPSMPGALPSFTHALYARFVLPTTCQGANFCDAVRLCVDCDYHWSACDGQVLLSVIHSLNQTLHCTSSRPLLFTCSRWLPICWLLKHACTTASAPCSAACACSARSAAGVASSAMRRLRCTRPLARSSSTT